MPDLQGRPLLQWSRDTKTHVAIVGTGAVALIPLALLIWAVTL